MNPAQSVYPAKSRLAPSLSRTLLIIAWFVGIAWPATAAPRQMERLGRAVTPIKVSGGVLVTWRIFGPEFAATGYNLYRDGVKLNATPITGNSNHLDPAGTLSSTYVVRPVTNGTEGYASPATSVQPQFYRELIVKPRTNYRIDDCATGDLDGDGDLELVLKRIPNGPGDQSTSGIGGIIVGPNPVYLEAYELDGTFKWEINLGPNANYTPEIQFLVYDIDGDRKAEVMCQTYDGTVNGNGRSFGDTNGDGIIDYRRLNGGEGKYLNAGPEYFSIFSGLNGSERYRGPFIPRGTDPLAWGDDYWHRATKYLWCIAYLDGVRPSIVFSRGYYALTKIEAWDFRNSVLTKRWSFSSDTPGNEAYAGQGNHQINVGDVDGDGKDEIVFGSACIDDDGTGKYSTGLRHGDAMHLSDMDPDRPGLEIWDVHETGSIAGGGEFRDANTGALIWGWETPPGTDTGRGLAAHVDANHKGFQLWSSARSGGIYTVDNVLIGTKRPEMVFATYWTGSLQREILGGSILDRWNGTGTSRVVTFYNYAGATTIGGTKSFPCLQADLFGDWREELIFRSGDETRLVLFTPNTLTSNKFYTFMHDKLYRLGIAWQMNCYNQPPHVGFYIGTGMGAVPTPEMYYP